MTRTELLALAERLTAHGRADDLNALVADTKRLRHSEREAVEAIQTVAMQAAAILRKLAELRPVAWRHQTHDGGEWLETRMSPEQAAEWNTVHASQPLYQLSEVLTDE